MNKKEILDHLNDIGINYQIEEHEAVFTVEDSYKIKTKFQGKGTKNLFIRNKKGSQFYLIVVEHSKKVDLKELAKLIGCDRISFGNPEKLKYYLNVEPGSVTMLSLIMPNAKEINVFFDREIWESPLVSCHPMINTATIEFDNRSMKKFLETVGINPLVIDVPIVEEVIR